MMKKKLTIFAAAAAVTSMASSANAVMVLTIDDLNDGAPAMVIMDGGAEDTVPGMTGFINYAGMVGDWAVAATGQSSNGGPLTSPYPHLDLGLGAGTSAGAGQLLVSLTDVFPASVAPTSLIGSIGGTLADGGSVDVTIKSAGGDNLLTIPTEVIMGSFFGGSATGVAPAQTIPMTLEVLVTHDSGGDSTTWNFEGKAVPDGGTTLSLLGLVLVGLAGAQRKFRKA